MTRPSKSETAPSRGDYALVASHVRNGRPEQEAQIWAEAAAVEAKDAAFFEEFEGALLFPKAETSPWTIEIMQDLVVRLDAGRRR